MSKRSIGLTSMFFLVAACGGTVVTGTGTTGTGAAATTGTGAGTTGTGAGTTGTGADTTGTGAATTGNGASTTTGTGASTTTGTGGGSTGGGCPSSPPGATSCAGVPDQLRCTYGSSVRPDCREAWQCTNGEWVSDNGDCLAPPPSVCGTSEPAPQTVCANMGDVCTYGDTICYCGCGGGLCADPVDWLCSAPPAGGGCPAIAPNDGTACSAEGASCLYGSACTPSFAEVNCTSGRWVWNLMIACAG